ncbi:hypothetical protein [Sphingomonas sp. ID0503]|uniref:hypothetical protein n=1 Tax=Sphingomonas sp. ID0503 TaxID=3399691 RepID=UPI003AFACAFF
MRALVAARPLQDMAAAITQWLAGQAPLGRTGCVGLQLRIERDWQNYIRRKKVAERIDSSREMVTTNPHVILGKLRRTPAFAETTTVWACCDEGDLTVPKSELRRIAADHGLKLLFKTDLPAEIVLPDSPIKRSMIDYALCRNLPCYVGLTRSSFSNSLFNEARWNGEGSEHWAYNRAGEMLVRR